MAILLCSKHGNADCTNHDSSSVRRQALCRIQCWGAAPSIVTPQRRAQQEHRATLLQLVQSLPSSPEKRRPRWLQQQQCAGAVQWRRCWWQHVGVIWGGWQAHASLPSALRHNSTGRDPPTSDDIMTIAHPHRLCGSQAVHTSHNQSSHVNRCAHLGQGQQGSGGEGQAMSGRPRSTAATCNQHDHLLPGDREEEHITQPHHLNSISPCNIVHIRTDRETSGCDFPQYAPSQKSSRQPQSHRQLLWRPVPVEENTSIWHTCRHGWERLQLKPCTDAKLCTVAQCHVNLTWLCSPCSSTPRPM